MSEQKQIFENEDEILKISMPANRIPPGSIVSKSYDSYSYKLITEVRVWPTDKDQKKGEKPKVIKGIFLEGVNGNFNQVDPDKVLVWHVPIYQLYDYIRDVQDFS